MRAYLTSTLEILEEERVKIAKVLPVIKQNKNQ